MPVYHITYHAYGTWLPDREEGYYRHDEVHHAKDFDKANLYRNQMTQKPESFDEEMQKVLIAGTFDICKTRGWTFYGGATDNTHFHALIGSHEEVTAEEMSQKLKNLLSLFLGRLKSIRGHKWFVHDDGICRVKDREHFDHLLTVYFPKHSGVVWRQGAALPVIPARVLEGE